MSSVELVVVGAGPAGLAAALGAARRGVGVVLLEAADGVGGMAASTEVANMRVDLGSHRLHPSIAPEILEELRGLLGDDLEVRPRNGRLRFAGRWVRFPLRATDLLRRLPPGVALSLLADSLSRPLRGPLRWRPGGCSGEPVEQTYAEVVRRGLGPTTERWLYGPYAPKLWGLEGAELSGELARRRIGARGPAEVARRMLSRREGRTFLYPRRGFGQISEALAEAASDAGAEIRLGARVDRIRVAGGDGFRVTLRGGEQIHAGGVWSTLPLGTLLATCDPAPPPELSEAVARLEHRAMVLVYLVVDRPQYTPFDAHYIPDTSIAVSRLSEPKNYRSSAKDPPGHTVLCAEVPCWEGDSLWSAGDAELGEVVTAALADAGLPDPGEVGVEVRRLRCVYPVWRVGTERLVSEAEAWIAGLEGLLTLGRQGLHVQDNTHQVLEMGWAAAASLKADGLARGGVDRAAWDRAREGFRSHVVHD